MKYHSMSMKANISLTCYTIELFEVSFDVTGCLLIVNQKCPLTPKIAHTIIQFSMEFVKK